MAETTEISWCDHTFNPWTGCQKVSPACDGCYAESWAKRSGLVKWGPGEERRRTTEDYWKQPLTWNRKAERDGVRRRVFCASLADVFDNQVDPKWRDDLFGLIDSTPALDWLLLTKRPQNVMKMLPADHCLFGSPWPNVWLGTTAEDAFHYRQRWAHIAAVPAVIRFLSYEPALGPIGDLDLGRVGAPNWVIFGGETGPGARPTSPVWARAVRDQCAAKGVPYHHKQWGDWHADALACTDMQGRCPPPNMKIGKKKSGALLDGVEHRAFPVG